MAQLPITNVVNVSVSEAQQGVGEYNVNNLGFFTSEKPADSFGSAGYAIYLDPSQVAVDFGSDSQTFAMANTAFSQQPNMLAGDGYLTVMPYIASQQVLTFGGVAASGTFLLNWSGNGVTINWNSTAADIQSLARTALSIPGLIVSGSIASQTLSFALYGVYNPGNLSTSSNSLETSGSSSITITPSIETASESLAEAIVRTEGLVQYFGILTTDFVGGGDISDAADVVQPLNKLYFAWSGVSSSINDGNIFDNLRSSGRTHTRCLYYGTGGNDVVAIYAAAYAGRALSTNFNGSNTTSTMHLKSLVGIDPDLALTQTDLTQAVTVGADTYPSLQGVPKVFTSGANSFFDQVYNLQWLVGALQAAGFNYLAESDTKIPQTEAGMVGLKGAYRTVLQQAVANEYLAPGSWTSSTTFGNQIDFLTNIGNFGYYIYSQPVSQQSPTDRAARMAPLCQIAVKEAGAVQSSNVIIYINA